MDKNSFFIEINKLASLGLRNTAIDLINEHLENNPRDPVILRILGRLYLLEKKPEEAVKYLQLSLKEQSRQFDTKSNNEPYELDGLDDGDFQYIDENANVSILSSNTTDSPPPVANETFTVVRSQLPYPNHERNNHQTVISNNNQFCYTEEVLNQENNINDKDDALPDSPHLSTLYLQENDAPKDSDDESTAEWVQAEIEADLIQLDIFDDEFIDEEIDNEFSEYPLKIISQFTTNEIEENEFGWNDLDDFDEIDETEDLNLEHSNRLTRSERSQQIAVEIVQRYGWDKIHLPLMQSVFFAHGWAAARVAIEREMARGLTPEELRLAVYIRQLWGENQQYWISFIHVKSASLTGQVTRDAYKNMSWSESLRIIRSFNNLPSEEEIQQFIEDTYENWYYSARSRNQFKTFIRFLKYRIGSVRSSLPGNELFSFYEPYENESFLDYPNDLITNTSGIHALKIEGIDIEGMILNIEQKYSVIKTGSIWDEDINGNQFF